MNKKLGIIIPHRNRWEHLNLFRASISMYLRSKKIPFEFIIVNQDDAKQFNRGMILNIGFKYARKLRCDYVVFHDVDLIPIDVDYSYSDYPVHLATKVIDGDTKELKIAADQYFGGVTLFPMEEFRRIDGYSNKYWGWGFEDDDLFLRCKRNNSLIDTKKLKNSRSGNFTSLLFNGKDSYVRAKNTIDIDKDITIFLSFNPVGMMYDPEKDFDNFTAFSIPGYDTAISYNSFMRYNFCTFDENGDAYYVNSDIKPNYQTNVCVTINAKSRKIVVYQDGIRLGETGGFENSYSYEDQRYFYLGAGNPKRKGDPNFYSGFIDTFGVIEKELSSDQIVRLCKTLDFSEYKDSGDLHLHYDSNFIESYKLKDLSGNGNDGSIFKCEIIERNVDKFQDIDIPMRRQCTFESLKHEENGFFENKWKDKSTRWNQLRFHNEVLYNNEGLIKGDGLRDLKFTEHGKIENSNITQINVGI
jgi:hypothetical protein